MLGQRRITGQTASEATESGTRTGTSAGSTNRVVHILLMFDDFADENDSLSVAIEPSQQLSPHFSLQPRSSSGR